MDSAGKLIENVKSSSRSFAPESLKRKYGDQSLCTPQEIGFHIFDVRTGKKLQVHQNNAVSSNSFQCENSISKLSKLEENENISIAKDLTVTKSINKSNVTDVLLKSYKARQEYGVGKVKVTPFRRSVSLDNIITPSMTDWSVSSKSSFPYSSSSLSSMVKSDYAVNDTISSSKIVKYIPQNKTLQPLNRDWKNPVIGSTGTFSLPSLSNSKSVLNRKSFDQVCCSVSFTKGMLTSVNVLGQVDEKFIACVIESNGMIILVDQHAAHERIRLEKLLKQINYYSRESSTKSNSIRNQYTRLIPPAQICFYENEIDLIFHYTKEFSDIGLKLSLLKSKNNTSIHKVFVSTVPSMFVNVCHVQVEAKGSVINTELIKEFINEQVKFMQDTNGKCNMSSTTIFKVLASYACHGAIKFGNKLSLDTCKNVMKELAKCDLPFQCAHGRPSIAPLVKLKMLDCVYKEQFSCKPKLSKLSRKIFHSSKGDK